MNCKAEILNTHYSPITGAFRLLLGLTMLIAGIYISTFSEIQGHGLDILLILGSPFVILEDSK